MALKQVERSATTAFSPSQQMIATGTMAGAIDLSVSTSASLELFQLDLGNPNMSMPSLGGAPTNEPFNRLSWGATASDTATYPYGILAGGLVDGSVSIWNPAKILSEAGAEGDDPLITRLQKHSGAVMGLEFNKLSPNLLASGGEDGELCIWDLSNPATPSLYPGSKGGGSSEGAISYLAWNNKVQHILASTTLSGTAVVWDLKRQKAVIRVKDPNMRQKRCSMLQWSPDVPNQLIVSYDDDRAPSLQIWDLRNSISPLRELHGHSKGVLSMGWCPFDSAFVVTCGKDNRTLCWDTNSAEVLCELPASNNWNFHVQWSPTVPGILSTSSFDGFVTIHNIERAGAVGEPEATSTGFDFETINEKPRGGMKRAPKWMKRPSSVSFGFGGKLISTSGSEIKLRNVVTEKELVKRSNEFEAAVSGGEKQQMKLFCASKAEAAETAEVKETWHFLQVLFEDDARRQLLSHLDFASALPTPAENGEHAVERDDGETNSTTTKPDEPQEVAETPSIGTQVGGLSTGLGSLEIGDEIDDGEAFFDRLDAPQTPTASTTGSQSLKGSELPVGGDEALEEDGRALEEETNQEEEEKGSGYESMIQRALVVGNYEAAVQACIQANRMADALVLASIGGAALWSRTQDEYMKRNRRPYMKVLSAVVNNDLRSLVVSRPLELWKETLALLCTYARSEDWTGLCDSLAGKLAARGDNQAAILCYICAGNIDHAVQLWSSSLNVKEPMYRSVVTLQDIMEKAVVLGLATGQKKVSSSLSKLVGAYADLLASQGQLNTALEYLSLIPTEDSTPELAILRDRIYNSAQVLDAAITPPPFPFEGRSVETRGSVPQNLYTPASTIPSGPFLPSSVYTAPSESQLQSHPPQPPPQHQPRQLQPMQPNAPPPPPVQTDPYSVGMAPPPMISQPTHGSGLHGFRGAGNVPTVDQHPSQVPPSMPVQPSPSVLQSQQGGYYAHYGQTPTSPPAYGGGQPMQPSMMMPTIPKMPSIPSVRPHQFIPAPGIPVALPPQQPQPAPISSLNTIPAAPGTPKGGQMADRSIQDGPPPTVQTADTSLVSDDMKPVVSTLTRLFSETTNAVGGVAANAMKRREIEDNSRKLGSLFTKMNAADISPNVASKLKQLTQALDAGDYASATHFQVALTTSDWDECSGWLMALKRMIKQRQGLGR